MAAAPGHDVDELGRHYVTGRVVAVGSTTGKFGHQRFYACPLAAMRQPWVGDAVRLFRHARLDGVGLRTVLPRPSAAAIDALEVIDSEFNAVREYEREDD